MGKLVLAGITPHPPIMVAEVGKGEEKKVTTTRKGMNKLARELAAKQPETIVVITPHGAVFSDAISISLPEHYGGDLGSFGAGQVGLDYQVDNELADLVYKAALTKGLSVVKLDDDLARNYNVNLKLDHGVMVPLSFFDEISPKPQLLQINMGFLARQQLYSFGLALKEGIENSARRVAVIASSDLSHCLIPGATAGYDPKGKEFDLLLKKLLEDFDVPGILSIPPDLQEGAKECGYRPILMLLGALDGYEVESTVLSYEGPFGVGYLVAQLEPLGPSSKAEHWQSIMVYQNKKILERKAKESPIVQLARQSLEYFYQTGKRLKKAGITLDKGYPKTAGVFVTLKQEGRLRGCIGTTEPTKATLEEEIVANAIKAATQDPRFEPVEADELDLLSISVDVLGVAEEISGPEQLDPQIYGVIVSSGWKRGLLLPALEGINRAEEQIDIASQKAGIRPGESVKLERFRVTRYN
ncbi:MAG: AmmeMemoRadiSam system protein A [Bacillota bacterium]